MSETKPNERSVDNTATEIELDPVFKNQIDRLYSLTVYGRWCIIALLWLTIGLYSLWELRYPITLIQEDFTWAAVRYGLSFHSYLG